MIGVKLNGRLGNQMFQYAFAMALADKYHTYYLIDNNRQIDLVKKYFRVHTISNNKITRKLFKKWIAPTTPLVEQEGHESVEEIMGIAKNSHLYHGYFQSELFFYNIREKIHFHFRLKESHKESFNKKYGHLFKRKVLAIHYRLGDYLTWGSKELGGTDLSLPESYYQNALRSVSDIDNYSIIVVTDDKVNIVNKLSFVENKFIVCDHEILDFQVLMNADIVISSNSSFSWWACYLNPKKPLVYAPEHWLGFKIGKEYPQSAIPPHFVKIPNVWNTWLIAIY